MRHVRAALFFGLDDKFVDALKAAELAPHRVCGGDILITKMGEPPGDSALYPDSAPPGIITADVIKWSAPESVNSSYLTLATRSFTVRRQVVGATQGVAQKKISLERFARLSYPLPPFAEQNRIVAEIERRLSVLDALDASLDANLARYAKLRQAILKRAFEGRLVPTGDDGSEEQERTAKAS